MFVTNTEQMMILIHSLDENVAIKYSYSTGKFYISADIWRKEDDGNYKHSSPHCSTINEVVREYYRMIQGKFVKNGSAERCAEPYRLPILIEEKQNG
jgi:hypothetical protein